MKLTTPAPPRTPNQREPTVEQSSHHIRALQTATHVAFPAAGAVSGAAVGAAVGSFAGPPGVAVGAAFGAIVGGLTARALDVQESRDSLHDTDLDDEIGVTSASLGAAPVTIPPPPVVTPKDESWAAEDWPHEAKPRPR